ncbi:MAG: carbohydrate ABC transporter permease [Clostridia bacterium]|nr:carbohydrate ABC transporter permease [Clostridia bacterium]MBR0409352.1 carbohydrate ABC transporter permease [Clostridia bacterium]
MVESKHWSSRLFVILNYIIIGFLALSCLIPLIHIFAISLSDSAAATGGLVVLWPVNFTLESYAYVARRAAFWHSMLVSVMRVLVGVGLNMVFCIVCAYPLSKDKDQFRFRTVYAWYFFLTMLVSGGLIPLYMVIRQTGLMGTFWALVIPGAVPVYNIILLLNFFRQTPRELEEAAIIDGAGQWRIMWQIFVPTSTAALATVALLSTVYHWNEWFNGILYMKTPDQYPLQSYLRTIVIDMKLTNMGANDWQALALVSDKTVKCAQIFLASLPILLAYPFLQRYFVKGMVLGSVKG